ncbi:MAG: mannonate dehydratase [Balneolaceae bacterium]
MALLQSWRWYGPNDIVSLSDIEQAGAEGIVHALHHVPVGDVWTVEEIKKRKRIIEWDDTQAKPRNLKWVVVESLNVHESIKKGLKERDKLIENFNISLKNLAQFGIKIVCYNFMPLLDWTRTDLGYVVKDGSKALRYDAIALAAFDLFILKRNQAKEDYSLDVFKKAEAYFKGLSEKEIESLTNNVLQGVPGSASVFSIDEFQKYLAEYDGITIKELKENLKFFLEGVIPTAESLGIKLCCHPDDPPYPIFGLPRIVSNEADLKFLTEVVESPSNGITFCTGSLGPHPENDLAGIVKRYGHKFHFLHLRNVSREEDGSFHEADHLGGSVDMYSVMRELVNESNRRKKEGREDYAIPYRPDHGHQMLDDLAKDIPFHGYSAIGRLRGLAELRGLELGIRRSIEE